MEDELECAICCQLLVDPVVGRCGHDFCRVCLLNWAQMPATQRRGVVCPLCRNLVAEDLADAEQLGVCVRLKRVVETLYPEKILMRRRERSSADADKPRGGGGGPSTNATSASPQATLRPRRSPWQNAGDPRSDARRRRLRVRRTRQPQAPGTPPFAGGAAAAAATLPSGSAAAGMSSPLFVALPPHATVPFSPALVAASVLSPGAPAPVTGAAGGSPANLWMSPDLVNFTMGWYEAPSKDQRRRRTGHTHAARILASYVGR